MECYKSYRFRLYPNDVQVALIEKHFGATRYVYNYFLNIRKETYLTSGQYYNYHDSALCLTKLKKSEDHIWLKEINSQCLQSSLRHLESAYSKFFKKETQFPSYKSKKNRQTFNVPQSVKIVANKLFIPKFKKGISLTQHRSMSGNIISATIIKENSEKYYVSILCKTQHTPFPKTNSKVGIDTGIKHVAVLSDGTTYSNLKPLKEKIKGIKYLQKRIGKGIDNSGSNAKKQLKLAIIHEKIKNKRMDHLQKITTNIVKNHDVICIEDLAIKNMMKNHNLAQSFADVSLAQFYSMLEYKCAWNDKELISIDRYFPSSKMCSNCNYINSSLKLSHRTWTCTACNKTHDRDVNASINIKNQGLKIMSGLGTKSDNKQKQAEASL